MAQELDDLSLALAMRLRDLGRMVDRLDRLETGTGGWLQSQGADEWRAAADDITLRALRAAADPINFSVLGLLARQTSLAMAELEQAVGLGRLALSERVNDLVQVGLAARNIDTDHVQATAGGAALARLVDRIGAATASRLAEALRPETR